MLAKDLISVTPEVLRAQPTAAQASKVWFCADASISAAEMYYTVMAISGCTDA
ncbi:hypothetical protein G5V57_26875 [Nordella sp. HKS 07]|uniref:hypothetical protein n=1 Tax=Nordella sp. HKS 07 TaxID=2712222 RepID=UPI0013E134C9|nr:hypothetical protein [Nordella sp. HKS 07]QIG51033.1 hypothetical protein G5V57_26875 [Nordella sp. HKS 07]